MAKMYDGAPNHISLPYLHNTTTLVPNSPHKDEIEIRKPALKTQKRQTRTKPTYKKNNNPKTRTTKTNSTPHKKQTIQSPKSQIFFLTAPTKIIPKISSISLHKPHKTTPKYQAFSYTLSKKQLLQKLKNHNDFPTP